jgi:aspartate aminotransferase
MPEMVSRRPALHSTNDLGRVKAAARAREAKGERVIHLEQGEPDFETPAHIVEAMTRAVRDGRTHHYPDARGDLGLRETLAEKLSRENGIVTSPDDIVPVSGGTHGLNIVFQALLSPGDEVLVPSPHWMAIPELVRFAEGATMRAVPLYLHVLSGAWGAAEVEDALRAALRPETKGIYVNSPNNPTGAVLAREHLEAIARVAIEGDLWVISDEAYEHLLFDGARHVSLAALPGMASRTVSVYTLSKSYAMTGWRIGYVVSPPALRAIIAPRLSFYTTHGVFPAVQAAARAAVSGPQDDVERMRRSYEERRDLLLAGLAGCDALRTPVPRGAFYAFPDVSGALGGRDTWALVEDWLEAGVAVMPGGAFGDAHAGHVRLSLASRREDIVEAASRMVARCEGRTRA